VNLKQLKHLVALADEGRFVTAAERVHLSQAAFSRSIQTLEEHLGLRLFERGPGGADLTPAGRMLVERARKLVFDGHCLERDAELMRQGNLGDLAFGASPLAAATLLPRFLPELRRQAPKVVAKIRSGSARAMLAKLEAEAFDFFVADSRMFEMSTKFDSLRLGKIPGGAYVREDHPLLNEDRVRAWHLPKYGLGAAAASPAVKAYLARTLGFDSEADLPLVVECDDVNSLARAALEGDLVVLLPSCYAASHAAALRPLQGLFGPQDLFVDLQAIWLRGRTLAPSCDLAIDLLRSQAQQLAAGTGAPMDPITRPSQAGR